jgi:hypothetical protein
MNMAVVPMTIFGIFGLGTVSVPLRVTFFCARDFSDPF